MFSNISNKYLERSNSSIDNAEVLHEINGIVLYKTSDALFYLNGNMVDEVIAYCKTQGYEIDRITFVTSYDIDLSYKNRTVEKIDENSLRISTNKKMESDARIAIIQKDDKIIAKIFMGSSINIGKT